MLIKRSRAADSSNSSWTLRQRCMLLKCFQHTSKIFVAVKVVRVALGSPGSGQLQTHYTATYSFINISSFHANSMLTWLAVHYWVLDTCPHHPPPLLSIDSFRLIVWNVESFVSSVGLRIDGWLIAVSIRFRFGSGFFDGVPYTPI